MDRIQVKRRRSWLLAALLPAGALAAWWLVPGPLSPIQGAPPAGNSPGARVAPTLSRTSSPVPATLPILQPAESGYPYEVVAGEVVVRLRPDLETGAIERLATQLDSDVIERGLRSGLLRLRVPAGETIASFERRLHTLPEVLEARPHAVVTATGCATGDYRPRQWNLDLIEQADACEHYAPDLESVVVAVLDTGVAYEQRTEGGRTFLPAPDLAGVQFVPGYDFFNDDPHPNDDHQHGTHIAGVIGATGRASGVAPGVRIMPIKVLGADRRGGELDLIEGIYHAVDHGADVINLSLAFGQGYFPSAALQEAIAHATDRGVVLVASAGNDGVWGVKYPAAFPDVIAVGASRLANPKSANPSRRAPYSQKGWRLDLLAPGGLLDTDLNRDDYPDGVLAQTFALNKPDRFGYWLYAGTSQAAAHVSGMAAWLLADGVFPAAVRPLLQASADDMKLEGFDPAHGAGAARLEAARELAGEGPVVEADQYYVNLLPRLVRRHDLLRAVVRIEVIDARGEPAPGVGVGGSWFGSVHGYHEGVVTDANGVGEVVSPETLEEGGVAIGFQVDLVLSPGAHFARPAWQFYSLSPASAEIYARLLEDPVAGRSLLVFRLDPADQALHSLFDPSAMVTSYIVKPVGPGLRSGPLVVAFDGAFAPEISSPPSGAATPLTFSWNAPLYSGRGMLTSVTGTLIDLPAGRLGSDRVLVLPLDPAMARLDLDHSYPVLNAYTSIFLSSNRTFGNGFASSTMGDGFASSTMADGFASSTMGDGFACSTMGDGFASSTLGSGFASSTMGDGFASSTMGDGFASSALAAGTIRQLLEAAFVSRTQAEAFEAEGLSEEPDGLELGTYDPAAVIRYLEDEEVPE